ncbi:archease [uncultured Methanobrevibacter sp.]|uniref:archease n=1 Tax=uncultured Methanobrevibacter sp. TaxID=253161 RepID=UPI00263647FF
MCDSNKSDMCEPYKYFEVTADIGFYAYGNTIEKAYENAGLAMFNIITDISKVKNDMSFEFEVVSEDLVSLLYDYLDELLFLQDTEFVFFSRFDINIESLEGNDDEYENYKLNCIAYGEEINWDIHVHRSEVKAVTFHQMNVLRDEEGNYELRAILDL